MAVQAVNTMVLRRKWHLCFYQIWCWKHCYDY